MATRHNQPKTMSGRLAGMKFMQRAGGSPATPITPDARPTKKQRLSNGSALSTPSTLVEDQHEREGYNQGETKWYLSYQAPQATKTDSPLRIVSAGYSALDSVRRAEQTESEDEDDANDEEELVARPTLTGRRSFGKFNKKIEKQNNPDGEESASDGEEEEEEEDAEIEDDPTGVKALIAQGKKEAADRVRAERKAKRAADSAEAQRLARERREKDINLNKVTSISSGGGPSGSTRGTPNAANMTCHTCGNKGHIMRDCPQKKQSRPRLSY